jgi:hypothetical protein
MRIADLNSTVAYHVVKQLLEQILDENRGFTSTEREIALGLLGLTGATTFGKVAEFWKIVGDIRAFNENANDANSKYEQFEQRQHLVAFYIKELELCDYLPTAQTNR